MVGRKPSLFGSNKKTALKGRHTSRPKKAPKQEEDEEILSTPTRKPKEKKRSPRRDVQPSAPQQQLSTEDKRRMRQQRQRRRTIWRIVIVAAVVILTVVVWLNWDVLAPNKLWASFQDAISGGVGGYPVNVSGNTICRLDQVEDYTVLLTDSHLAYRNKEGAEVSRYTCTYAKPLMRTEGEYVLVAEQGGRRLQLSTRSDVEQELESEYKIRSVSLNAKGQFAVLTDGPQGYTVQITIYDKNGKTIYTRKSNRLVSDVALSPDGTTLSAVSVEETDGTLSTRLEVFSLSSAASDAQCTYQAQDTLLYRAAYLSDNTLVAVGEHTLVLMNTADGGVSLYSMEGKYLLGYAVGGDTVALAMRPYGDTAGGEVVVLTSAGSEKLRLPFEGEFRHLSGGEGRYALLTDSAAQALTADGVEHTVSVPADGRQVVFAEGQLVVMGLNQMDAYPME